jgi:hypothetical protein
MRVPCLLGCSLTMLGEAVQTDMTAVSLPVQACRPPDTSHTALQARLFTVLLMRLC